MIVETTKGKIDDSQLEKKAGIIDDENEFTQWVEYWLNGELVHRSVHVTIKKMPTLGCEVAALGG
jgi:hypothetical protein